MLFRSGPAWTHARDEVERRLDTMDPGSREYVQLLRKSVVLEQIALMADPELARVAFAAARDGSPEDVTVLHQALRRGAAPAEGEAPAPKPKPAPPITEAPGGTAVTSDEHLHAFGMPRSHLDTFKQAAKALGIVFDVRPTNPITPGTLAEIGRAHV